MAKKKPAVRKTLPTLVAFLLCDGIARDPNSKKYTLYGLFDRFAPGEYPATVQLCLFTQILGGTGEHKFSFVFSNSRGKPLLKGEFDAPMVCTPGVRKNLILQVHGLELPKPGRYKVELQSDGKVIGSPREVDAIILGESKGKSDAK